MSTAQCAIRSDLANSETNITTQAKRMPRKGRSANSAKARQVELDRSIEKNAALQANQILAMNGRNRWKQRHSHAEQVYYSMVHTRDCLHEACCHIIQNENLTIDKNEVTFSSDQMCNSGEQFDSLDQLKNNNANYEHNSHGIQDNVDAKLVGRDVVDNSKLSQDQESPRSNNSPDQELPENNDTSYGNSSFEEHLQHNCKTILAGQQHQDISVSINECRQTSSIKRETDHSLANISDDSVIRQDAHYQENCLLNNNNNEKKTNDVVKANSKETLETLGCTDVGDRREQTLLTKNTKSPRKRTLSSHEMQIPRRYGRKISEHQSCTIRSTENINPSAAIKTGIVTDQDITNNNTQVDTQVANRADIKVNSQVDTRANQLGENSSASKLHRRDSLTNDAASKEAVSRDSKIIEESGSTINETSDEAETGVDNLQPNTAIKAITVEVKGVKEINSSTDSNTKQHSTTTAGNVQQKDSTISNNLKDADVSKDLVYVDCATEATSKTVVNRKDKDQIQYSSVVAESAATVISHNNTDVPSAESIEVKQYQIISIESADLNVKGHAVAHGADEVVLIKTDNVNNTNVTAVDNINEE